ncbi:hypothetical protein MRB53_001540 [Persea americana]|uniref:Uncharacterized protein n=1 Tax=Persea americana TaxID=3435 RepID=A0ACC2MRZ1_PERAE|nr:hypothetical protein MRB53_001540 [Persea americana]
MEKKVIVPGWVEGDREPLCNSLSSPLSISKTREPFSFVFLFFRETLSQSDHLDKMHRASQVMLTISLSLLLLFSLVPPHQSYRRSASLTGTQKAIAAAHSRQMLHDESKRK